MFGLFKKTPKLEMTFAPRTAVARELAKEVEVAGDLVVTNVGKDAELAALQVVLVAGGTRRIELDLPAGWSGTQRIAAGGTLKATVDWKVKLAAPMRAPAAEIQLNTTAGGKTEPLARSNKFPLENA
jgi:hypothetical protein